GLQAPTPTLLPPTCFLHCFRKSAPPPPKSPGCGENMNLEDMNSAPVQNLATEHDGPIRRLTPQRQDESGAPRNPFAYSATAMQEPKLRSQREHLLSYGRTVNGAVIAQLNDAGHLKPFPWPPIQNSNMDLAALIELDATPNVIYEAGPSQPAAKEVVGPSGPSRKRPFVRNSPEIATKPARNAAVRPTNRQATAATSHGFSNRDRFLTPVGEYSPKEDDSDRSLFFDLFPKVPEPQNALHRIAYVSKYTKQMSPVGGSTGLVGTRSAYEPLRVSVYDTFQDGSNNNDDLYWPPAPPPLAPSNGDRYAPPTPPLGCHYSKGDSSNESLEVKNHQRESSHQQMSFENTIPIIPFNTITPPQPPLRNLPDSEILNEVE
ncbi:hypothetical protein P154DRAFT_586317, partial [Amniculicola lignicola CBS 123094]